MATKSDKPTVLLLTGACFAVMLLFTFAWFSAFKDLFHGFFAFGTVALALLYIAAAGIAITGSEDPNKDWSRVVAVIIAIAYCCFVGIQSADHAVKKEEGIAHVNQATCNSYS